MSIVTDREDTRLGQVKDNGQNEAYLALSQEEIDKGYLRPVRDSYIHIGRYYTHNPEILNQPYKYGSKTYVATIPCLIENERVIGSSYITQEELDQYNTTKGYIGGCGTLTKIHERLAQTYARDPKFYSATFCVGCKTHPPVSEFVWDGTDEKVGS